MESHALEPQNQVSLRFDLQPGDNEWCPEVAWQFPSGSYWLMITSWFERLSGG
jgi:hypothetical protein